MTDEFDWYDPDSRAAEYARWMDTVSDPIHGRDNVPKSWKRMGTRITPQGGDGQEPERVTIHPKTTTEPNEWITSDTWKDLEFTQ